MGLFNKQESVNRGYASQAMRAEEPRPVQDIEMIVEYFDKTVESISVTSNLEKLQELVSSSFGTGASMNFSSANPPFSINPRWVKKIIYRIK